MNNFPAMTAEQRQALINHIHEAMEIFKHQEMIYRVYEIALAALTAEPEVWIKPDSLGFPRLAGIDAVTIPYVPEYPIPLYTAPPAPVLRAADGWIKCSERYPEIGSTVEVYMEKPIHSATPYAVATYDKYGFSRSKVTHWQPLPSPPEERNER